MMEFGNMLDRAVGFVAPFKRAITLGTIAVALAIAAVQTVRLEGFKVWPVTIEGWKPKAERYEATIEQVRIEQDVAAEKARLARLEQEARYRVLAERIDDDAKRDMEKTTDAAERFIAAGTHSNLYVMNETGTLKDITPTGFTSGRADAVLKIGYGQSTYGSYAYGVARPDLGTYLPATTWSMDTWGEYLVACSTEDGKLLEWQLDFGTPTDAAVITNAPTSCTAVMTTSERFVFALGAGGNQDERHYRYP